MFLVPDSNPLERPPGQRTTWRALVLHAVRRITCPRSQLEARLLFGLIFFGDAPEARPLCPRQTPSRRQLADRISV